MVTGNNAVTPQTPHRAQVKFVQGTDAAGTYKALYTAGSAGSNVLGLTCVNGDTASHILTLAVVNASGTQVLNSFSLTANAGNNGTVLPIALQSVVNWPNLPVDGNGNQYLFLDYVSGTADTLMATFATTLSAGTTIAIFGAGQDW